LLIVRAWVEDGSAKPLRAEIRLTTDTRAGFQHVRTLAEVDAVVAAVRSWLEEIAEPAGPGIDEAAGS